MGDCAEVVRGSPYAAMAAKDPTTKRRRDGMFITPPLPLVGQTRHIVVIWTDAGERSKRGSDAPDSPSGNLAQRRQIASEFAVNVFA